MSIICNGGKEEEEETFLAGEPPFSGSGPLYLGKQKEKKWLYFNCTGL